MLLLGEFNPLSKSRTQLNLSQALKTKKIKQTNDFQHIIAPKLDNVFKLRDDWIAINGGNETDLSQECSEDTSSVAFEVLIINFQIYFINLFIFNCLTLNIKLFIFKLFEVKFLFSENHVFRKQKRTAAYGRMDGRP